MVNIVLGLTQTFTLPSKICPACKCSFRKNASALRILNLQVLIITCHGHLWFLIIFQWKKKQNTLWFSCTKLSVMAVHYGRPPAFDCGLFSCGILWIQNKTKERNRKLKKKITDTLIYLKSKPENSPMRNLQALIVVGGE